MKIQNFLSACSLIAFAFATQAVAQSTQTEDHEYDSLGRLIVTDVSGLNNGDTRGYCYDELGNRLKLRASIDGSEPTCSSPNPPTPPPPPSPPPPPPAPPSGNVPPVADADNISGECGTSIILNITADDFDAEDDPTKPTLVSLAPWLSGPASATIVSASSVSVTFGSAEGFTHYQYIVEDSQGASDQATLAITTSCGGPLQ